MCERLLFPSRPLGGEALKKSYIFSTNRDLDHERPSMFLSLDRYNPTEGMSVPPIDVS